MALAEIISDQTVCDKHPDRATRLRCNRCDRYMCPACAQKMEVGYRCITCLRAQLARYYTGRPFDYAVAFGITVPLSLVAAILFINIIGLIGWFSWLLSMMAAPRVAQFIASAVLHSVKKRRSRYLPQVVAASLILTVAAYLLFFWLLSWDGFTLGRLFDLVEPGILAVVGTKIIVAYLK